MDKKVRYDSTAQTGYRFRMRFCLNAPTHQRTPKHPEYTENNERLEFLGDAVLQLVISDFLYRDQTAMTEGAMTRIRALIVCEPTLALVARHLRLGEALKLGKGEDGTGGRDKPSNLSNALEALFGAIYLDGGLEAARGVVLRCLEPHLQRALSGRMIYDYKSRLLELAQKTRGQIAVQFEILSEEGPVHERHYTAGVRLDDRLIAQGEGSSKKEAEQNAAKAVLERLDDRNTLPVGNVLS